MYRISQSNTYIRRHTFTAHAPSQPAISSLRTLQNHVCLKLQGYGNGPHSNSPTSRTHTFIFIRRTKRSIRTRTNSNGAGYLIRYCNEAQDRKTKNSWFVFQNAQDIFLFSTLPRQAQTSSQSPIPWVPKNILWKQSGLCVALTTYLHLMPRLKTSGVIQSRPTHASMAYTAKTSLQANFTTRDYKPLMLADICITSCEADVREGPVCEWVRQTGYAGGEGVF